MTKSVKYGTIELTKSVNSIVPGGCLEISGKFLNLDTEKQKKIRKAALKEFTANGYEDASTNRIVGKAGISKGSLFYYFETKQELYKYLIEYSLNFITKEFLNKVDEKEERDLIEKYRKMSKLKLQAYNKNPDVFNFLGAVYINDKNSELPEELLSRTERIKKQIISGFNKNVDTSLFRQDISPDRIIKLISWSMEGYERELISKLKGKMIAEIEFEPYWDEFHDFLDLLKKIYYRQEMIGR